MNAWQVLESMEADFEKMTWTFSIGGHNEVSAGQYAVIPASEFRKQMDKLESAEKLLNSLQSDPGMSEKNAERVARFFDPEPA